jgi:tRNA(Ile)-lysidine synthase
MAIAAVPITSPLLLAISGGIDSVCLLHMMVARQTETLIVAHVDHGIRSDSAADERFVSELAKQYHLPYVSTQLSLGSNASEEEARNARYDFLLQQAATHQATIVTAHHQDDAIETIALNLWRGTGWRGLAVLNRPTILRPFIELSKSQLYRYALKHRLEWVEDSTNASSIYQRNRLRRMLAAQGKKLDKVALMGLRAKQIQLKKDVESEERRYHTTDLTSRHFMIQLDNATAGELIATVVERLSGYRPTRPQAEAALLFVKTARSGSCHQVAKGVEIVCKTRYFEVRVV